jgi:lincosamide nucleotidyltransferase B/F
MDTRHRLLARLDAIGRSLEATGHALALIGLGSVGAELERIDAYSDLDFFVIAKDGRKRWFLEDLTWMSRICPIAYQFLNTDDGYKLLYQDGIFCEFAIFERAELLTIPFAQGRIVWREAEFNEQLALPIREAPAAPKPVEWLIGEIVTNLYVGLGRYHRGEKLSAARFIQQYAVDRVLELAEHVEARQPGYEDQFVRERRFEQRFPITAQELAGFIQGYERSRESAVAILAFVERHFEVNPAMARAVRELC